MFKKIRTNASIGLFAALLIGSMAAFDVAHAQSAAPAPRTRDTAVRSDIYGPGMDGRGIYGSGYGCKGAYGSATNAGYRGPRGNHRYDGPHGGARSHGGFFGHGSMMGGRGNW